MQPSLGKGGGRGGRKGVRGRGEGGDGSGQTLHTTLLHEGRARGRSSDAATLRDFTDANRRGRQII